jgi:tetratricopeptide (TPR) repeat protein
MGIAFWRSAVFFFSMAWFGLRLFPSERELGLFFSMGRSFDQARFYLAKQFHEDPADKANALRYLEALMEDGQYDLFERSSGKMLEVSPKDAPLHGLLARYYETAMQFEDASRHWMRMIQADPDSPRSKDARDKLASYYTHSKDDEALLALYEERAARYGGPEEIYYELARIYLLNRRVREAESAYRRLLESFPEAGPAKLKLAEIYEYQGRGDEALALYRSAALESPEDPEKALFLARALMRHKKHDEALEHILSCRRHFPRRLLFLELLADVYGEKGEKLEALRVLEEALVLDPYRAKIYKMLGELYFDTGDNHKAQERLRSYHEKTGGDYRSHHVLGDVLRALGDKTGSRREYEKALELLRGNERAAGGKA